MSTRLPSRRGMAVAQLVALSLSFALSFEVSACPPGMDTGMEMPMPVAGEDTAGSADMTLSEDRAASAGMPASQMDCPFGGPMGEDGRGGCPLAVGGIGTCGTGAPTPGQFADMEMTAALGIAPLVIAAAVRVDYSADIQVPPPRL